MEKKDTDLKYFNGALRPVDCEKFKRMADFNQRTMTTMVLVLGDIKLKNVLFLRDREKKYSAEGFRK